MKTPLILLTIIAVILGSFWLFAPQPDPSMVKARTDLPWQITVDPDGSSHVFDLHLGQATLSDAIDKFGETEGLAVFQKMDKTTDLEAYFGDVMFGPLKAKVIVKLNASEEDKAALIASSLERKGSPTGDWKFLLASEETPQQLSRKLTAISYVPSTRGLDADFFLKRFGEPASKLVESEEAVSWFYPQKGLSILIDNESKEILEYVAPRDFVAPKEKAITE